MYGLIHQSLAMLVLEYDDGQRILDDITAELDAGVKIDQFYQNYEDPLTFRFLQLVAEKLDITMQEVLRRAGTITVANYGGFADALCALGDDLYTLMASLDSFHDNLHGAFKGLKAPSFRPEKTDNHKRIIVRYYSQRHGLAPYVVGMVEEVSKLMFGILVNITIVEEQQGSATFEVTTEDERGLVPVEVDTDDTAVHCDGVGLAPSSVNTLFPWHIAVDKGMKITSIGPNLAKRLKKNCLGMRLSAFCRILRPVNVPMTFEEFQARAQTPYVISIAEDLTKLADGKTSTCSTTTTSSSVSTSARGSMDSVMSNRSFKDMMSIVARTTNIQLHGEVTVLPETDTVFFAGIPMATNVDQLNQSGISLEELPIHSHGREMAFSGLTQSVTTARANETADMLEKQAQETMQEKARNDQTAGLLHRILPTKVADALMRNEDPPAETFDNATVLFSDIVGFTNIASHTGPDEVMDMLNNLFRRFDALCEKHGVYKVETIGDAYMVVAGVPEPCADHADRCAAFAIDMAHEAMQVLSPLDGEPLRIRVGMHSGPVMAGVVGDTRPRYCLFGDTVNVASRMESTGLPGAIQMSYRVVRSLFDKHDYDIIERGRVMIKGKGVMKTFLLLNRTFSDKPRLLPQTDDSQKTFDIWQDILKEEEEEAAIRAVTAGRVQRPGNNRGTARVSAGCPFPVRSNSRPGIVNTSHKLSEITVINEEQDMHDSSTKDATTRSRRDTVNTVSV